ncbi:hypothetical protein NX059_002088 [Plenodomus lindquistii]|nr:hypothetical protein NX059_002088 [Plenodomus lindquistii]
MSQIPAGHPVVPNEVSVDDLVAIVTVHDSEAIKANKRTEYHKVQVLSERSGRITRGSIEGCHVFLTNTAGQVSYSMGRSGLSSKEDNSQKRDVYLTTKQVDMRHLSLVPIKASNAWRLQSTSHVVAVANGVPIQSASAHARGDPQQLPCAVYLRQDTVNRIEIKGLRVDVWLMKTVNEAYPMEFPPFESVDNAFAHRTEAWAQRDQYLLREQVSNKSHRILHRLTGEVLTAKVFRDISTRWQLRKDEFQKFGKAKVDASIVRYHAMLDIDNIPAVITDTHEGMVSYTAARSAIMELHPGNRFLIAAKLQRRLFSALDFLHYHGIIHRNVAHDSVLIRLVDVKAVNILLVDYSTATSATIGTERSRPAMLEDGRAAMEIVEDCCNIWQLRNKRIEEAGSDEQLAIKVISAEYDLKLMQRVYNDFCANGGDQFSEKGRKLLTITKQKSYDLDTIKIRRAYCATMLAIGICLPSDIDKMAQKWVRTQPQHKIGEKVWMHLSLGHPYFDNLTNELRYNRWESTPREICAQYRAVAGTVEEPWQSLTLSKLLKFERHDGQLVSECVLTWLASCCEVFPEWHDALKTEYQRCVQPHDGLIETDDLRELREALSEHGTLPVPMTMTFDKLFASEEQNLLIVECKPLYSVIQHVPSGMFNLTQLQRLAGPDRFVMCVQDLNTRCDTFVEVRGEPSLQGCYAPLGLLSDFAQRLGLTLVAAPETSASTPIHDPADFSQVPASRIVLVRRGLLAFASMLRGGNECCFHAPRIPNKVDVLTDDAFRATYFGDMKIIPNLPQGSNRWSHPEHWSKFRTAEEQERAADLSSREVAIPKAISQSSRRLRPSALSVPRDDQSVGSCRSSISGASVTPLARTLKARLRRRAQARLSDKRNTTALEKVVNVPCAKRPCTDPDTAEADTAIKKSGLSDAHLERIAKRLTGMADDDIDKSLNGDAYPTVSEGTPRKILTKLPYPIQTGNFNLAADWEMADKWVVDLEKYEADELPSILRPPSDATADVTEAESIDEEVLNKHRAAIQKEAEIKEARRRGFANAKAQRARGVVRKTFQSRNQTPEATSAPNRTAVPTTRDATVPHTPAFSSPTPMLEGWLDAMPMPRVSSRMVDLTEDLQQNGASLPDAGGGSGSWHRIEKEDAMDADADDF